MQSRNVAFLTYLAAFFVPITAVSVSKYAVLCLVLG